MVCTRTMPAAVDKSAFPKFNRQPAKTVRKGEKYRPIVTDHITI
jgi:hypothetical protein